MISYLQGKILNKGKGYLILLVGEIGYQVFTSPTVYAESAIGQKVEFYIYHNVREDAILLFGFKSLEELEMFTLLLTVSGIGPKSALGILSIATVAEVVAAINQVDPSLLTKVSGIGNKTAERVILELKGKISSGFSAGKLSAGDLSAGMTSDEIDVLMALGYSMNQAREALKKIDPKIKESSERIKQALKNIK